ncbi:MAG: hypothetical protein ACQESD_05495 [Thermoplasmatota archaeon]
MFKNKEKIIEKVKNLPKGEKSESGRYWCVTCKKLFELDEPVCPYMPKVCLNSPIAVENMPPESTEGLEKFGLFYPKIPQMILAKFIDEGQAEELVDIYFDFLEDWNIRYEEQPLQTIKSFIITVSGCETAQRVEENKVTFIVTDIDKVWEKDKLFKLLGKALDIVIKRLDFEKSIVLDDTSILGDMPMGKYYCPMCQKFFEFSIQRDTITCPLMAQKCMATPTSIEKMKYGLDDLIHVYDVTPSIYKDMIEAVYDGEGGMEYLEEVLKEEWDFDIEEEKLRKVGELLGISS